MLMPSIFGENLFDDFLDGFRYPARPQRPAGKPDPGLMKTDIKESDAGFDLAVELPGYKKEDMKLELKDGYLTISAETSRKEEEKDEKGNFIRRERFMGRSSRSFFVGEDITHDDIKAKYEDGILNIFIPKKEQKPAIEEPKYITIEG